MKLIGLFGVLLAISPVFAAEQPGVCAGKVPAKTLDKCNKQQCTFIYTESTYPGLTKKGYYPCILTDLKTDCNHSTMDECLAHGCAYYEAGFLRKGGKKLYQCIPSVSDPSTIKAEPPRDITQKFK